MMKFIYLLLGIALSIVATPSAYSKTTIQQQVTKYCTDHPEVCRFLSVSSVLTSNCQAYKAELISRELMIKAIKIYMKNPLDSESLKKEVVSHSIEVCKDKFDVNINNLTL